MRINHPASRLTMLGGALAVLLSGHSTSGASEPPAITLRAFAVNMTGGGRARAGTIDIVVDRWSTDDERNKLRDALVEKGEDALLRAVQHVKPRAGFIRTSQSLGWDIQYAREIPTPDGGRRIILATDRPVSFFEARNRPRSSDYQFLLIEIRLNKDGKGEGKMATAAKITYDQDTRTVEIENYASEPVRLTQVEMVRPKTRS
jgi:hypothetical protein